MEILEIIGSVLTIISFFISLFVANKVYKIDKSIKIKKTKKNTQKVIGNDNITSGRDSNISL